MTRKRKNPDEDIRDLERRAKEGDAMAAEKLARELERRGEVTWELWRKTTLPMTNDAQDGYGDFPNYKHEKMAEFLAKDDIRTAQREAKKRFPEAKFGGRFSGWSLMPRRTKEGERAREAAIDQKRREAREKKRSAPVVVTEASLAVLRRFFGDRIEMSNRMPAEVVPHARKALKAGLLEVVDKKLVRLTAKGVEALGPKKNPRRNPIEFSVAEAALGSTIKGRGVNRLLRVISEQFSGGKTFTAKELAAEAGSSESGARQVISILKRRGFVVEHGRELTNMGLKGAMRFVGTLVGEERAQAQQGVEAQAEGEQLAEQEIARREALADFLGVQRAKPGEGAVYRPLIRRLVTKGHKLPKLTTRRIRGAGYRVCVNPLDATEVRRGVKAARSLARKGEKKAARTLVLLLVSFGRVDAVVKNKRRLAALMRATRTNQRRKNPKERSVAKKKSKKKATRKGRNPAHMLGVTALVNPVKFFIEAKRPPSGKRWADDSTRPVGAVFDTRDAAVKWAKWLKRSTRELMGWTPRTFIHARNVKKNPLTKDEARRITGAARREARDADRLVKQGAMPGAWRALGTLEAFGKALEIGGQSRRAKRTTSLASRGWIAIAGAQKRSEIERDAKEAGWVHLGQDTLHGDKIDVYRAGKGYIFAKNLGSPYASASYVHGGKKGLSDAYRELVTRVEAYRKAAKPALKNPLPTERDIRDATRSRLVRALLVTQLRIQEGAHVKKNAERFGRLWGRVSKRTGDEYFRLGRDLGLEKKANPLGYVKTQDPSEYSIAKRFIDVYGRKEAVRIARMYGREAGRFGHPGEASYWFEVAKQADDIRAVKNPKKRAKAKKTRTVKTVRTVTTTKTNPALGESMERWARSKGLRVPGRGSAGWGALYTVWQRHGMPRANPKKTRRNAIGTRVSSGKACSDCSGRTESCADAKRGVPQGRPLCSYHAGRVETFLRKNHPELRWPKKNPKGKKKRPTKARKSKAKKTNPKRKTAKTKSRRSVKSIRRFGDLPKAFQKKWGPAARKAARRDGIAVEDVPIVWAKSQAPAPRGLVNQGDLVAIEYELDGKTPKRSPFAGARFRHASGDRGAGKKKSRRQTVGVDPISGQWIPVSRRGSRPGYSSRRGLIG